MNVWENRPGGDSVENVFGNPPHIAASSGGQFNGHNAGIFSMSWKILQCLSWQFMNISLLFILSYHCFQPNGSFPDDPSYVQWRNRFLLPEFSVSVCIRWNSFYRDQLDNVVNKHKAGHQQTFPLSQHFNRKLTNKKQVSTACGARDEELVVQLQRPDKQRQAEPT